MWAAVSQDFVTVAALSLRAGIGDTGTFLLCAGFGSGPKSAAHNRFALPLVSKPRLGGGGAS